MEEIKGLKDKNGKVLFEGCFIKKNIDKAFKGIHGEWGIYEVFVEKGCVFFGFIESEKQKNFPRKYIISNILDNIENTKDFTFADEWILEQYEIIDYKN